MICELHCNQLTTQLEVQAFFKPVVVDDRKMWSENKLLDMIYVGIINSSSK